MFSVDFDHVAFVNVISGFPQKKNPLLDGRRSHSARTSAALHKGTKVSFTQTQPLPRGRAEKEKGEEEEEEEEEIRLRQRDQKMTNYNNQLKTTVGVSSGFCPCARSQRGGRQIERERVCVCVCVKMCCCIMCDVVCVVVC